MARPTSPETRRACRAQAGEGGLPESQLVVGDNLPALQALYERGTRAALVYLDPPFFTGREHSQVNRRRSDDGSIERELVPAFDDRWNSLDEYLSSLVDRIAIARDTAVLFTLFSRDAV